MPLRHDWTFAFLSLQIVLMAFALIPPLIAPSVMSVGTLLSYLIAAATALVLLLCRTAVWMRKRLMPGGSPHRAAEATHRRWVT